MSRTRRPPSRTSSSTPLMPATSIRRTSSPSLPKPDSYMGSELFFDVDQTVDSGEDEVIHQLAHEVPEHEAQIFTPRPKKIDEFSPEMTPTLAAAIRWFILATAIRELRTSKSRDSSMLVHTSQLVRVHQQTKEVISGFISDVALDIDDQEAEFRSVYEAEKDRAVSLRGSEEMPGWAALWPAAKKVLEGVVVKIDNGASDDRLVYDPDSTQTVIAVGGGTLSRGLTLEGLVVSYFLRSSNTYDTLLQMGRWFGFRPGYADLVRVWMGPGSLDEYAHLATVEKRLRDEVAEMEKEGRTPGSSRSRSRAIPGASRSPARGRWRRRGSPAPGSEGRGVRPSISTSPSRDGSARSRPRRGSSAARSRSVDPSSHAAPTPPAAPPPSCTRASRTPTCSPSSSSTGCLRPIAGCGPRAWRAGSGATAATLSGTSCSSPAPRRATMSTHPA
uniref:Z1 domain-containing protein n=1 Tax=Brachybacterium sp. GPGPB12 TaxID=3023517 RepID=UPI004049E0B7